MQLLTSLKKKPYCNDFHLILIPILLFIISIKYWYFIIILLIYIILIFRKTKLIIPILVLILFLIINISIQELKRNKIHDGTYSGTIKEINNENSYILSVNGVKLMVYDYNDTYKPGDKILVELELLDFEENSYEEEFDYKEYLYSQGISYSANGKNSKLVKHSFSLGIIKYNYLKYLKNNLSEESYQYVSAMVFGDNLLNDDIKDSYSILGISHILAISGLHIIFLYNLLSFILLKLFKYYKSTITLVIITIFVILIDAPSSCIRALLFILLGHFNKIGENKYTKLDILSISCIAMLLYNPYQLFSLGFILSYLVSFLLCFSNELVSSNNKLLSSYFLYFLIYLITFPFVVNINNSISLLSLLLSPILSSLVTYLILPLSYILSIFPILDVAFKYIFIFINTYLISLSNLSFMIKMPSFSLIQFIIYYIIYSLLLISIVKKRYRLLTISNLICFLTIITSFKFINPVTKVTFLNVGQGDSAVITLGNNNGVMVIDAYNSYNYLKSTGISKINYLVLTHSDTDHLGDYIEILEDFKVDKILYPKFDDAFNELLSDYPNSYPITNKSKITLGNINVDVLGPINGYEDPNSNSIVLKIKINKTRFLFCGDMTIDEENDLIKTYGNKLDSDILKVGHHGSNTSSSIEFLNYVTPSISIISAGKNNKYGHPDKDVLNRLKSISKVYETKNTGNITFNIIKSKLWVSTYR